jgi:acyl-CoA reductase-like NAD-dependent aldehyde dehydrogenase
MFHLPESIPLKFTASRGKYVDLLSPNDGSFLTKFQEATAEDVDLILKETKSIQKKMDDLRPFERANILKIVAREIKGTEEYLSKIVASEGGKPLKDARVEVSRAVATLELCAEETLRLHGEVVPMERTAAGKDHLAFTVRDAIGPVLAISAFNHPLNLIAHQVGTAIAAGCSVVLKPASSTPMSAHFLYEAFVKAGLPEKGLRVISGEISLIEKLVSSSEFDFVSFIGSAKVGWEMRRKIANGTRISLEHGGQAPAIIREDADLESAIPSLIKGAFYHAGQVCISTQRIFVHKNIYQSFVERFTKAATQLKVGSAMDEKTDVGPLIRPTEVVRLQKWIAEALKDGAKLQLGNEVSGAQKQYLSPTILTEVPRSSSMMKDEAFGPVVCLNSFDDEAELLRYLNSNHFIFEAAIFTKDISKALKTAQEIKTMTFVINNHSAFRVDQMPFGGHKESGLGMGGVKYAIEEQTRLKQIIMKI